MKPPVKVDQAAASLARATGGEVVQLDEGSQDVIAIWLSSAQGDEADIPF